MTENEIESVLSECDYRGNPFRIAYMCQGGYGVGLDIEVEDASHPGVTMHPTRAVPIYGTGEAAILRAAFAVVMRHERHEAAEFFTYRGTRPFDPHAAEVSQ